VKRLVITEGEKKEILKQYNLLTEGDTPTTTLNVEKKVDFEAGHYSEKYIKAAIDPEIKKISDYLNSGGGKKYLVSVEISSGESKIPNSDNEKGGRLDPEVLSKYRMNTIESYITKSLTPFKDKGLLMGLPTFKRLEIKIGGPDWIGEPPIKGPVFCPKNLLKPNDPQGYACLSEDFNPGNDANGNPIINWYSGKKGIYIKWFEKYSDAQFVKVKISLQEFTELTKCLNNMEINVDYTDTTERHRCNNATYKIYITGGVSVPTEKNLLKRTDGALYASLDNADSEYDNNPGTCKSGDTSSTNCKRYNKFIVTPEMAEEVIKQAVQTNPKAVEPSFIIWGECVGTKVQHPNWGFGCHRSSKNQTYGVGDVTIVSGQKEKTEFKVYTPVEKGKKLQLKKIKACGTAATT